MADNLWCLGNTTIRNPERIPGALKVFKIFYDGKKSFENGAKGIQSEFEINLGKHNEEGDLIKKGNEIPIVNYDPQKLGDIKGKNARQWLSIMDDYGMTNSYNKKNQYEDPSRRGKAYITKVGETFLNHVELRNEIWLRQVLKFQVPHYKKQLNKIKIRAGWWFLKLMIECNGLRSFEIGMASLFRNEEVSSAKKMIVGFREKYEKTKKLGGSINDLEDLEKGNLLNTWFKNDWETIATNLKKLINDIKNGREKLVNIDQRLKSKKNKILGLGKGPDTPRAKTAAIEIKKLLENSCYDVDKHTAILKKYFGQVKGYTIWKDYVDANSRILKMTGYVNWIQFQTKSGYSNRLTVYDEYYDLIKTALDDLPCVKTIDKKNEKQREEYYDYLVDVNKPRLKIDNKKFVVEQIKDMTKELTKLGKSLPPLNKDKSVDNDRIRYNQLLIELKKAREEEFIKNQVPEEIKKEIEIMIKNPKDINPITLESVIWRAIGHLGGYVKHISETRNFGLDSNFKQIFTAGGGVPDMQFHYEKFDEIVEVTKMGATNKGQINGEFVKTKQKKTPVPTHVANHKFHNDKITNCIFIAPSIHLETIHQCWLYSCKNIPIAVKGNYKNSEDSEITFHIVPVTIKQFLKMFLTCYDNKKPSTKWIEILSYLHQITNENENNWMADIEKYVNSLWI